MTPPPLPDGEPARLAALRSLRILDTAPEERFDRLTRLAKRLFGVPIALVSLVDEDRQWFKSVQGLEATQTPRAISFCGHAILEDELLLVPDASRDARFADNPLVVGAPEIRFYAGCPLKVPDGSRLGTLCLIDTDPREFDDDDRQLLRDLGRMAEQELAALQMATMDELTLLSNRRGFEALAGHALGLCRRQGLPASLLFFDLDGFKSVNDRYGHAEGDRALVEFARLFRQAHRESDVVGRHGGDEFVALLTGAGPDEVRLAVQRLRWALDAHDRRTCRGYALRFSVGTARYDPARHASVAALIADADAAMYRDKSANRAEAQRIPG
jgi:diguanylate cyclase (GGDEF)-like protein